jgi:hypothetical protein
MQVRISREFIERKDWWDKVSPNQVYTVRNHVKGAYSGGLYFVHVPGFGNKGMVPERPNAEMEILYTSPHAKMPNIYNELKDHFYIQAQYIEVVVPNSNIGAKGLLEKEW